ncbi:MAG: hypothetical protein M1816_004941 [Peltula sp. TS41687]|nr:MAG: hypothetical protein M1816_004941 [Peltula sp. TS41687]
MVTSTEYEGKCATIRCDHCKRDDTEVYFNCGVCNDGHFDVCHDCKEKGLTCSDASHTLLAPSRVEVEVCTTDDEIRAYVSSVINEETPQEASEGFRDTRVHPNRLSRSRLATMLDKVPELVERIADEVTKKAQDKFLLAKLYMDSLKTRRTLKEVRNTLNTFPDNWKRLYEERMNERVLGQKPEDRDLALKILSVTSCARRPLTLAELGHALAIEPGDREFDPDGEYQRAEILDTTKGLLTIDDGDDAHSYVRFFHLTLQKYLEDTRDHWFPQAETDMATACLTCLEYDIFSKQSEPEEDLDSKLSCNPFAEYALQFWGEHARNAQPASRVEELVLQFLQDPDRLAAYIQAAWYTGRERFDSWDVRRDIDAMHVCAVFGFSSLILKLGLENYNVNIQEGTYGQTPLIYACRRGHLEAAQQLLELGADINLASENGRTALLEAIAAKHGDDADGSAALSLAACRGLYDTVKALLAKPDIEVNAMDQHERTALYLAAVYAETNGSEIIRALMEHGADPNICDGLGGVALSVAIERGRTQVVRTLLELTTTNLSWADDGGCGLMHYASRTKTVSTPLHATISSEDLLAAEMAEMVKLLLDLGADPAIANESGMTPLALASEHRNREVINVLGEKGKEEATASPVTPRRLPVWELVKLGRIDLIAEAIAAGDADLSKRDPATGDGALHFAVSKGRDDFLRMLLGDGKLDPNSRGRYECSPLHIAANHDRREAVKVLLEHHADLDLLDKSRFSPLSHAEKNHLLLAIALVEAGANVDPDAVNVQKLFFAAVEQGRVEAVKILLDKKVDPLAKNEKGLVARQIATETGKVEMMRLLDSTRSFVFNRPYITSENSSSNSIHSMPSPSMNFMPFRRKSLDLSEEVDDAEPKDVPKYKPPRLNSSPSPAGILKD